MKKCLNCHYVSKVDIEECPVCGNINLLDTTEDLERIAEEKRKKERRKKNIISFLSIFIVVVILAIVLVIGVLKDPNSIYYRGL